MASVGNTKRTGMGARIGNVNATLMELDPSRDKAIEEVIVTTGYFPGDVGIAHSSSFFTASNNTSNNSYYFDITDKTPSDSTAKKLFSCAYGHYAGSGSDCQLTGSNDIIGPAEAVYNQFATMLLPETEITGGFHISKSAARDDGIYVMLAQREQMQDAINRKNWSLTLSGSNTAKTAGQILHLTDDSVSNVGDPTMYGLRYNIVSGSQGTVHTAATDKNYGFFYPNLGVWVFSESMLSSSINGASANGTAAIVFDSGSQRGFGTNGASDTNEQNGLRLVNCIVDNGTIQIRNEEVQQSVSWFCRVPSRFMNFTSNPTFISGSRNELRNKSMQNNPQVYITTVGLYNGRGEVVATAKLSTPLVKNFGSEVTIKVKLTY